MSYGVAILNILEKLWFCIYITTTNAFDYLNKIKALIYKCSTSWEDHFIFGCIICRSWRSSCLFMTQHMKCWVGRAALQQILAMAMIGWFALLCRNEYLCWFFGLPAILILNTNTHTQMINYPHPWPFSHLANKINMELETRPSSLVAQNMPLHLHWNGKASHYANTGCISEKDV